MFINKLIMFAIFATFVACGLAYESTAYDPFTLDEFVGKWYFVATIYPPRNYPQFACEWQNISKKPGSNEDFNETFSTIFNGKKLQSTGYGKVVDSKVRVVTPSVSPDEVVYGVTKFNNGNELILHNQESTVYSSLISRDRTASAKAKVAFESKAAASAIDVTYINQNCLIEM